MRGRRRRGAAWALLSAAALLGLSVSACADPCDEAIEVLDRRCGIDTEREPDAECEGERARFSRCVLAHPAAACAYLYDPVSEAGNAFDRCVGPAE